LAPTPVIAISYPSSAQTAVEPGAYIPSSARWPDLEKAPDLELALLARETSRLSPRQPRACDFPFSADTNRGRSATAIAVIRPTLHSRTAGRVDGLRP